MRGRITNKTKQKKRSFVKNLILKSTEYERQFSLTIANGNGESLSRIRGPVGEKHSPRLLQERLSGQKETANIKAPFILRQIRKLIDIEIGYKKRMDRGGLF